MKNLSSRNYIFLFLLSNICTKGGSFGLIHSPLDIKSNPLRQRTRSSSPSSLQSSHADKFDSELQKPNACLLGYVSPEQKGELTIILKNVGFGDVISEEFASTVQYDATANSNPSVFKYKYIKASGMLKLIPDVNVPVAQYENAPKYIPVQSGEENVLVANGWSFLDPDQSEPLSAFDIDAANADGKYTPKWGTMNEDSTHQLHLSSLGFNLKPMDSDSILLEVDSVQSNSKNVLLEGGTDKPNVKITNNGYDFSGSLSESSLNGLFTCAIGGNPLFTSNDLSPLTGSSGWLTFARPVSEDHIKLLYADKDSMDQRVEVVDSKTGCHLGHYFGTDGYCINASALNFFAVSSGDNKHWNVATSPVSWQIFSCKNQDDVNALPISQQILRQVLAQNVQGRTILFGAGCFWHVEHALRRLPYVIETEVGYAGGFLSSPTYEDVCKKNTSHAEVVRVIFDPAVCDSKKLIDCFLTMHDPTNVRAHGKRAKGTGQYRSCIFTEDKETEEIAQEAIIECRKQLARELSTDVRILAPKSFWVAEESHQLHDQRVKQLSEENLRTLSEEEWLLQYGRRSSSIFGSSETIEVALDDSGDDGMARMMI